jgi:Possible lysine decarboxylase
VLTLIQTGKNPIIPIVFVDVPAGDYWQQWQQFIREQMVTRQLIDADDLHLFRITDEVEEATAEIFAFYRVFHSARFVEDDLIFRLKRPLPVEAVMALQDEYADILKGPLMQRQGPLLAEGDEWPALWRLVIPFTRSRYGRLRRLIDAINRC